MVCTAVLVHWVSSAVWNPPPQELQYSCHQVLGQSVIWKVEVKVSVYCKEQQGNHSSSVAVILFCHRLSSWYRLSTRYRTSFHWLVFASTLFIESSIYCYIDSSQCLAQLTPARIGIARSVHVQLGASTHVIRWDIVSPSPQSHISTRFGGLFKEAIKMSYQYFWRISQKRVHVQQIHQLDRQMSLLQQASLYCNKVCCRYFLACLLEKLWQVVAVLFYPSNLSLYSLYIVTWMSVCWISAIDLWIWQWRLPAFLHQRYTTFTVQALPC